jgi:hypothetical protein
VTVLLKIPTRVGNERAPIRVRYHGKWIGDLSSCPKVVDGKFIAGKCVLVSRNHELVQQNPGKDLTASFQQGSMISIMEVRYGAEVATYRLYEDRVVYSDGPPHPDNLQLAVRVDPSGGVAEP